MSAEVESTPFMVIHLNKIQRFVPKGKKPDKEKKMEKEKTDQTVLKRKR